LNSKGEKRSGEDGDQAQKITFTANDSSDGRDAGGGGGVFCCCKATRSECVDDLQKSDVTYNRKSMCNNTGKTYAATSTNRLIRKFKKKWSTTGSA